MKKYLAELNRRQHIKKKYGLSMEEYDRMLKEQNHCCGICKKHEDEFKFHLAVDHCHNTLRIRGLLCTKCNVSLGWYEDYSDSVKNWLEVH